DHRRLPHHQGGKLVIRRTPIPGLHNKIISRGQTHPGNDLTSYHPITHPITASKNQLVQAPRNPLLDMFKGLTRKE
ncbi:hypothetical protein, partial [Amycolatopsis balhimycina]|uniref:hypothetical protein n=1 Tax=Amycolatopsis balhimycina TaxID=208443 RepID=UPI001C8C8DCE